MVMGGYCANAAFRWWMLQASRTGATAVATGGYHRGRIVHDLVVSDWLREGDRYPNSHDLRAVPALDRRRALCAGRCWRGVAGGRVHRAAVRLRAAARVRPCLRRAEVWRADA